jgi:hypothetical protein
MLDTTDHDHEHALRTRISIYEEYRHVYTNKP